jgi:hypothetical protein
MQAWLVLRLSDARLHYINTHHTYAQNFRTYYSKDKFRALDSPRPQQPLFRRPLPNSPITIAHLSEFDEGLEMSDFDKMLT